MRIETHHWYWIAAALGAFAILATVVTYDIGGVFSAPGLEQE
jgi:hypothetical protein